MALDFDDILDRMLNAARETLQEKWPLVASTARERFQDLAQVLINIEQDKLSGDLTEDEAKELMEMHQNAVKTALEEIKGIGKLLAEAVINAVLRAVRDIVNSAVGWTLV